MAKQGEEYHVCGLENSDTEVEWMISGETSDIVGSW